MTLFAAFLLATAAAPPPDKLARFETALAADDWEASGGTLNDLIEASVLNGSGGAPLDPRIADAIGRFELRRGGLDWAIAYLGSVPDRALAGEALVRHRLARAQAYALAGEHDAAIAAYDAGGSERPEAALGLAHVLLTRDPGKALQTVAPLSGSADAAIRWRAAAIETAASSLLGRRAAAQAAAARAWSLAAELPPQLNALRRSAALLAAVTDDRRRIASLVEAAQAGSSDDAAEALVKRLRAVLPTCGAGGVEPSDYVQLIMGKSTEGWSADLMPVSASRPEIVGAFLAGIASPQLLSSDQLDRSVFSVTLRCRTAPGAPRMTFRDSARIASWSIRHGLYYPVSLAEPDDADELLRREERLARREQALGPDSPLLVPTLLMSAEAVFARAATAGDVTASRSTQLAARAASLARKLDGGSAFFPPTSDADFTLKIIEDTADEEQRRQLWEESIRRWFAEVDPASAFRAAQTLVDDEEASEARKMTMLDFAVAGLHGRIGARDQAMRHLRGIHARHLFSAGRDTEARVAVRDSGLPADLCQIRQQPPEVLDAAVTSDDYPREALSAMVEGRDVVEFDIDAAGAVTGMRPIVELPAGVFSGIAASKRNQFRMQAARESNKPVACRGMIRSIRWQFPGKQPEEARPAPSPMTPGT